MSPGFRYHVASLLAVFFSLVLGMLIGGAVFSDHSLVEEQALLISELEERFRENNAKLAVLQAELDFSTQAWLQLRESIVRDRLAGRAVILVGEGAASLLPTLQQAGAQVETVALDSLGTMAFHEGMTVVFPLRSETLSSAEREMIDILSAAGTCLSFVWEQDLEPALGELPPSLRVDSIDTSMGEIAFLLALSANLQGHYGLQRSAERLFP
ncbi:MAG: copper transporter [Limnochordia bacterium]|jgi:hypothetical protein|nr:copper transporter [Bacillota bacterium]NLL08461.1 copper transporter [Bacillota bacterium]HBG09083.1 hypothetical protein [Bacillota bacterium]